LHKYFRGSWKIFIRLVPGACFTSGVSKYKGRNHSFLLLTAENRVCINITLCSVTHWYASSDRSHFSVHFHYISASVLIASPYAHCQFFHRIVDFFPKHLLFNEPVSVSAIYSWKYFSLASMMITANIKAVECDANGCPGSSFQDLWLL